MSENIDAIADDAKIEVNLLFLDVDKQTAKMLYSIGGLLSKLQGCKEYKKIYLVILKMLDIMADPKTVDEQSVISKIIEIVSSYEKAASTGKSCASTH